MSDPENSYSGQAWLGVGPPLVIGVGIFLAGVALMLFWRTQDAAVLGGARRASPTPTSCTAARPRRGPIPTAGRLSVMTVVLGYDESPGADAALRVAIEVASRFGSRSRWSTAWPPRGASVRSSRPTATRCPRSGRRPPITRSRAPSSAGVEAEVDAGPGQAGRGPDPGRRRVRRVGDRGRHRRGRARSRAPMLGSTPHKLLHLSTRPVLCVPLGPGCTPQAMSEGFLTSSSVLRSPGDAVGGGACAAGR